MQRAGPMLLMVVVLGLSSSAQEASPKAIGSMSELMVRIIYPASDALFYAFREPPKNDQDWNELQRNALTLAEAGNLLMTPARARDNDKWMKDARLVVDAGAAAFKAAKEKNLQAILDLNDALYQSCITCHMDYRQGYGRRR